MKLTVLFVFLISGLLWARPHLVIDSQPGVRVNRLKLERQFEMAYAYFEQNVAPLNNTVTISVTNKDCLRVGYDIEKNKVVFCSSTKIINSGLDSHDVFNHEIFHAFLCSYRRDLCGSGSRVDLHEGLADYFAYRLRPDASFGENFYQGQPYVRRYKTTWRLGLVQGEHERGNVYVSSFIQGNSHFKDLLGLFDEGPVAEEVSDRIEGAPKSKLNKYRLRPRQLITLSFVFKPEARVERVVWEAPPGMKIDEHSPREFSISLDPGFSTSKVRARFLSSQGTELGHRFYYFGLK